MTAIAKATSRIRNTKGACYLTHGDDAYDKRGLNKARRAMDKAIIDEQQDEATAPGEITAPEGTTFRLVIWTQIHENYGAHCWDGKGECPQYWKAKGGSEYHHQLGDANAVITMGREVIDELARSLALRIAKKDEYWEEYAIGWEIVPSTEKTQDEEWGISTYPLD